MWSQSVTFWRFKTWYLGELEAVVSPTPLSEVQGCTFKHLFEILAPEFYYCNSNEFDVQGEGLSEKLKKERTSLVLV